MNYATARVMLKVARKHDSITIEADAMHLMTDVWTSAGVLGGLLVILFFPNWQVLDPLIAIAVGLHIIYTGVQLLRRSVDGLMDTALSPREIRKTEELIQARTAGRERVFMRCARAKRAPRRFIEFHLLVPGEISVSESHALCDRIEASIASHLRGHRSRYTSNRRRRMNIMIWRPLRRRRAKNDNVKSIIAKDAKVRDVTQRKPNKK